MADRRLHRAGFIGLLLGFAALYFMGMLTALHAVGTDADLYYREQTAAAVLPLAGISDDDLRLLDERLAAYLSGDGGALYENGDENGEVLPVRVFGELQPAFNEREMTHMRDCFGLFALLRKVRGRLVPWAVLLIVGGAYLLRSRAPARRAAWLAVLVSLVPLGAFAAWAALDFDAAFTFFHKMLFTNDLWLLDPRTDLLIRICPERMFMAMGLRIALWSLAFMLGVPALVTLLTALWPKRKEDNTWNNRDMRRASAQKQIAFGPRAKR